MYVQEDHVWQLAAAPELKAAGSSLQCWELCSLCSYHYWPVIHISNFEYITKSLQICLESVFLSSFKSIETIRLQSFLEFIRMYSIMVSRKKKTWFSMNVWLPLYWDHYGASMRGEVCKTLHHRCSVLPMLLWQQQLSEHLQPMAPWKQLFSIFRIQNYKRRITINLQVILVKIILDDKLITYSGFQLWQKKKKEKEEKY